MASPAWHRLKVPLGGPRLSTLQGNLPFSEHSKGPHQSSNGMELLTALENLNSTKHGIMAPFPPRHLDGSAENFFSTRGQRSAKGAEIASVIQSRRKQEPSPWGKGG